MIRATLIAAPAALALASCAAPGDYPSLAKRPAERAASAPDPEPSPTGTPAAPDAALRARIARAVSEAEAAHARFGATRGRAEARVAAARGAPVASENWSLAAVALAELEAARTQAMIAMAALDAMLADDRLANYGAEGPDSDAIAAGHDRVARLIGEEDRALAALRGQLRS